MSFKSSTKSRFTLNNIETWKSLPAEVRAALVETESASSIAGGDGSGCAGLQHDSAAAAVRSTSALLTTAETGMNDTTQTESVVSPNQRSSLVSGKAKAMKRVPRPMLKGRRAEYRNRASSNLANSAKSGIGTNDGAVVATAKTLTQQQEHLSVDLMAEGPSADSQHEYPDESAPTVLPQILALYFPQFHKESFNDRLWGEGFTDWVNLKEAPERNRLGYKIIRPTSELGYYDLTNTTVRKKQGEMAKAYGIDGFVYHHYWFYDEAHPGPTLHAPLEAMLEDGHPDLPFAFNWVAENWTATWHRQQNLGNVTNNNATSADDGKPTVDKSKPNEEKNTTEGDNEEEEEKLLQRQFFPTDDEPIIAHYQWLRQFFHRHNYIKVEGKPLLMVYRDHSDLPRVLHRLKELAIDDGFPGIHISLGYYASHPVLLPKKADRGDNLTVSDINPAYDRLTNYPFPYPWMRGGRPPMETPEWCKEREAVGQPRLQNIMGIATSFDNTPRRVLNKARMWIGRQGEKGVLYNWITNLHAALHYHACCYAEGGANQFVLINAWNEWAEGMALEPSDLYGRRFLEILKVTKLHRFDTCGSSMKTLHELEQIMGNREPNITNWGRLEIL